MSKVKVPLNKEVWRTRIAYVEDSLRSLERFKGISFEEFHSSPDHFRITFYDLHRSLEAIMDIGSHILPRIPGARPSSYRDIPRLLEKYKESRSRAKGHPRNLISRRSRGALSPQVVMKEAMAPLFSMKDSNCSVL